MFLVGLDSFGMSRQVGKFITNFLHITVAKTQAKAYATIRFTKSLKKEKV